MFYPSTVLIFYSRCSFLLAISTKFGYFYSASLYLVVVLVEMMSSDLSRGLTYFDCSLKLKDMDFEIEQSWFPQYPLKWKWLFLKYNRKFWNSPIKFQLFSLEPSFLRGISGKNTGISVLLISSRAWDVSVSILSCALLQIAMS